MNYLWEYCSVKDPIELKELKKQHEDCDYFVFSAHNDSAVDNLFNSMQVTNIPLAYKKYYNQELLYFHFFVVKKGTYSITRKNDVFTFTFNDKAKSEDILFYLPDGSFTKKTDDGTFYVSTDLRPSKDYGQLFRTCTNENRYTFSIRITDDFKKSVIKNKCSDDERLFKTENVLYCVYSDNKVLTSKVPSIDPSPSGGGGSGGDGGGVPTIDLTKINEKIGKLDKLDNLDKLSFLEKIYKECVAIKDKISSLDILKDILDYLKKILYENQKTNDYFSTLMKSLDFDKHKVDNSNFKELLKFLQKFREDLFQDMANLDRDGDHPDLSAIYDINSSILSKLNDFMPNGILQNILSAIESLNGNVGGNLGRLNDSLSFIVRVIGGGGSGGSVTGGGGSGDTSNNFISSVTNITNNIKNLAGSEEQAKKDLDDLKDNMQKFVNQEPFGSGREAEEQLKKFKVAKPGKSIPVYSIEAFKGIKIPAMDFGPFLEIIADIRKILVAMLWISLFLYLVRVFIPKLKV